MVRLMTRPIHVRVHPQRIRTRKWKIFPGWRTDLWAVEIVGHGWTQAYNDAADVERMTRSWLAIQYNTDPHRYNLHVEYLTPIIKGSDDAVCGYCGNTYNVKKEGGGHFIPCNICDSLEHATCCH